MPTAAGSVITEASSTISSSRSSSLKLDTETATSSTGGVAGRQLAIEIETIERRVCATRRDLFVPVTVDPRPSRAVHCPDLNACLVNETRTGREQQVDCQAIHFGYAIPVNVVPLETDPRLAELVLDHSTELSRRAASFLLEHHPQLRQQQQQRQTQQERCPSMAATAKHDLRQKFPTETSTSGDEDIAAIAKQISDHAEAIYQTWKSRGLAPTEILNCHSNATAADKFGTALTPTSASNSPNSTGKVTPTGASPTSAVDILSQTPSLDNGNLEKLVNNFVVEDKARLAASRQRSPSKTLPSSIQFALEKFEKNSIQQQQQQQQQQQSQTSPLKNSNQIGNQVIKAKQGNVLLSPTSPFANKPSQIVKPQVSTKTPGAHHREVFLETIETTFPADITPSKIVVQQKRPTSTVITSPTASNHDDSPTNSGLTTWPLKNKLNDSKRTTEPCRSPQQEVKSLTNKEEKRNSSSNSSVYLDEVAREEERLINALKTGSVITEEPAERTVLPLTRQKPAIKREKPKVEPVKPIIIGHNNHHAAGLVTTSAAVVNSVVSPTSAGNTSATSDAKSLSKDDLSNMSVVDYAKVRYRAAQQNPPTQQRLEEQRTNNSFNSTEQLVSTTRFKFETEIQKDKEASKEEKDPVTSRWGPRINSPRPRIEQVPHPELTTQQKQHIRAAAATGTGNNPIRPFLTRGSVAERVLIFEKCPSELLLDKRGPRQPAINTWRTGHDVQNKAQVSRNYLFSVDLTRRIKRDDNSRNEFTKV